MTVLTYTIRSWSDRTYRARKNYCCALCGGIIPIGTTYVRHVERLGIRRGKDPLRNVHVHLNCEAPWYQPEPTHRLRSLGKLPGKLPPTAIYDGQTGYLSPAVSIQSPALGTMQWKLPAEVAQKLAFVPNSTIAIGAVAEIEQALSIVLTALVGAVGNRRQSLELSHRLNELTRGLL